MSSKRAFAGILGVLALACGEEAPSRPIPQGPESRVDAGSGVAGPASLVAEPTQVGFDCTAIGCNTTRVVKLTNSGRGSAIVNKVELTQGSSPDFTLEPQGLLPQTIAAGASFEIVVAYRPSDTLTDTGTMRVEFGAAVGGDVQTVQVELATRSIGTATLVGTPAAVNFGYVAQGARGTQAIQLKNTSTGTAIISVDSALIEPNTAPFRLETGIPPIILLNPGQSRDVNVVYEPSEQGVHSATVKFSSTSGGQGVPLIEATLRGTTYQNPTVALTPTSITFLTILKGATQMQQLEVKNAGADGLTITGLAFEATSSSAFSVTPTQPPATPLATGTSVRLTVNFTPQAAGAHQGSLKISTNDPVNPEVWVAVNGGSVWPILETSPASIAFGQLVRGWTSPTKTITLRNNGVGALEIQQIDFGPGSSASYTWVGTRPLLPKTLNENESVQVRVKYEPGMLGLESATIKVVSTDADQSERLITLTGTGVTCAAGCPMANATADCSAGSCNIGSCAAGYADTDGVVGTGCECAIESDEAGQTCGDARWLGQVTDDPSQSITIKGKLTSRGDGDWYNAFAVDNGGWDEIFGDDFKVRVRFTKKPSYPITMCVYHVKRGTHQGICTLENMRCSDDVSWGGSYGSGDDADVFVHVYTTSSNPTTCETYEIVISNG